MRRFLLSLLTVVAAMALMIALLQAQQWVFGPLRCGDGVVIPSGAAHDFCESHGGSLAAVARGLGAFLAAALFLVSVALFWRRRRSQAQGKAAVR